MPPRGRPRFAVPPRDDGDAADSRASSHRAASDPEVPAHLSDDATPLGSGGTKSSRVAGRLRAAEAGGQSPTYGPSPPVSGKKPSQERGTRGGGGGPFGKAAGRGHSRSSRGTPVVNPASAGGLAPPVPAVPAQRLPPALQPKRPATLSPALKSQRAPPASAAPSAPTHGAAVSGSTPPMAHAATHGSGGARAFQRTSSDKSGQALAMLPPPLHHHQPPPPQPQPRRTKSGGAKTPRPTSVTATGIATAAVAAASARRMGAGGGGRRGSDEERECRSDGSSAEGAGHRTPIGSSPPSVRGGGGFPSRFQSRGRREGTSTTLGGGTLSSTVIWAHFKDSCNKQSWTSAFLAWSFHLVHIALVLALLFSPMLMRSAIFSQVTMSRSLLQAQGLVRANHGRDAGGTPAALGMTTTTTPSPAIPITVESIWAIHDAAFFSRRGERVVEAPISESFTKLHDGGSNRNRRQKSSSHDGKANGGSETGGEAMPSPKPPKVSSDADADGGEEDGDTDTEKGRGHAFVAKKVKAADTAVYQLVSPAPLPRSHDGGGGKSRNRKKAVSGRTTLGKIVEAWEASPLYSSPLALGLYYYLYLVVSVLVLIIGTEGRLTGHFSALRMVIGAGEILWFVHHGGHSFLIFLWAAVLSRWPQDGLAEAERHFLRKGTPYATIHRGTGEVQFRWFYRASEKGTGLNGTPYVDGVLDMQRYLYNHAAVLVVLAKVVALGFLGLVVACVLKDALRVLEAIVGVRPLCEPEGYIRCPLCGELIEPCEVGALHSVAERRRRWRRYHGHHRSAEGKRTGRRGGVIQRAADTVRALFSRRRSPHAGSDGYEAIPSGPSSKVKQHRRRGSSSSAATLSQASHGAALAAEPSLASSSVYDTDVAFYEGRTTAMMASLAALASCRSSSPTSSSSSSSGSSGGTSASSRTSASTSGSDEVESSEEDENEGGIVKVIIAPAASPTSATGNGNSGCDSKAKDSGPKRATPAAAATPHGSKAKAGSGEASDGGSDGTDEDGDSGAVSRRRDQRRQRQDRHRGEKLYLSHATRHVHHRCPKLYLDASNTSDDEDGDAEETETEEGERDSVSGDMSTAHASADRAASEATASAVKRGRSGGALDRRRGRAVATQDDDDDDDDKDSADDGNTASHSSLNSDPSKGLERKKRREKTQKNSQRCREAQRRDSRGQVAAGRLLGQPGSHAIVGDADSEDGDMHRNRSMSPRRRVTLPQDANAAAGIPVFSAPARSTALISSGGPEDLPELAFTEGRGPRRPFGAGNALSSGARLQVGRHGVAPGAAQMPQKIFSARAMDALAMNYSFSGLMDGDGATLDRPYSQRRYPDGTLIPVVGGVGAVGDGADSAAGSAAGGLSGGGGAAARLLPGDARQRVGDHYVSRAVYDPFKDGEDEFRPGNAFPSYEKAGWYSRVTYNWLNPLVGFAVLEPTLLRNERFLPSLPEYLTSLENTAVPARWLWVNRRAWFASKVTKPGAIIPTEEALDVAEEIVLQLADLRGHSEEEDEQEEEQEEGTESSEGQAMVVLGKKPLTNARFRAQRPKKEMEERLLLAVTWPLRKLFSSFFYCFYIDSSHTIARTHKRLMRALLKDRLATAAALGELGYGEQLETTYALAEMASSEDSTEHGSVGSVLPIHTRRQLALSDVSIFHVFLEHRSGRRFVYAAGALLLVQDIFMFLMVPLVAALIRSITPHAISRKETAAAVAAASAARQGSVGGGLSYGTTGSNEGSRTTAVDLSAGLLCCLGIAVVFLVQNVAYQCYWSQVSEAAMEAKTALRTLVLDKVMTLPLAQRTFSDEEVVGLVQTEALRVSACLSTLHHTWSNPLCLLVAVLMLWAYIGWIPALTVLVEVAILVPVMRMHTAAIRQRQREAPSGYERQSVLMEALMNMRAVKAMLKESTYARLIRHMRSEEAQANKAVSRAAVRFVTVAEAGMLTLVVSFFVACYWTTRTGRGGKRNAEDPETVFQAAAVIPCMVVLTLMWNPITEFPALFRSVARGYLSMKRIEAFLRQSPDEFVGTWVDLTTAKEQSIGYGRGSVICRGCSFTWQHDLTQEVPQPQLINVHMDILPGEHAVVQGPVGAGKSTLLLAVLGEINRCVDLDDRSDAASPFLPRNLSSSDSFEVDSAAGGSASDVSLPDAYRQRYTESTALLAAPGVAGGSGGVGGSSGSYGTLGTALAAAMTRVTGGGNAARLSSPAVSDTSAPTSTRRVQMHQGVPHSPKSLAPLNAHGTTTAPTTGAGVEQQRRTISATDGEAESAHSGTAGSHTTRARTEGFLVFGSIAYCSEEPWLQSDTIRANITVGGNPSQTRWYQHVVRACALEEDFRKLPLGDKTVIGEKGAALSTSQKVRIALARALFTKADIYLFDSILTWLDEKTRAHVIKEVFHLLLRDKTVIIATNVGLSALRPHRIFTVQEEGLVREDTHLYREVSDSEEGEADDSAEDSGYEAQREERRPTRGPALTAVYDEEAHDANRPLPTLYAEEFEEAVVSDAEVDLVDADDESSVDDDGGGDSYFDEEDIAADELFHKDDDDDDDGDTRDRRTGAFTRTATDDGDDDEDDGREYSRGHSDLRGRDTADPSETSGDDGDNTASTASGSSEEGEADSLVDDSARDDSDDSRVFLVTVEEEGDAARPDGAGDRRRRHRHHHGGVSRRKNRKRHAKGTASAADKKKKQRRLRRKAKEKERRRQARRVRKARAEKGQQHPAPHSSKPAAHCEGDRDTTSGDGSVRHRLLDAGAAARTRSPSQERSRSPSSHAQGPAGRDDGTGEGGQREAQTSSSLSSTSSTTPTTTTASESHRAMRRRPSRRPDGTRRGGTIRKSRIPDTSRAIHIFIGFMGKQAWWLLLACLLQQLFRLGVDVWVGLWLVQPDWVPDALSNTNFLGILTAIAVLTVCLVPIRGAFFFSGVSGTLQLMYQLAVERVLRASATFFMEKTKTATTVLRILTKDMEVAEHSLPESVDIILSASMQLAAVVLFNALLNPCFVLVLPMAVILFHELTERYVVMIRELRRLENRSVSGTVALLRESLDGAPMVRCFALQDRIREEYCRTIDITNSAGMVAYMTERWVGLRLYFISLLLITSVAVLGVLFASTWMAPGLTGVALVLCLRTARVFTSLCRRVAHFHAEWSSMRRLLALLLRVPTEPLTLRGSATLRTFVQLRRPTGRQAELEDTESAALVHLVGDTAHSGVARSEGKTKAAEGPTGPTSAASSLASSSSSSSGFSNSPMTLPVIEMVNVTARYGRAQVAALSRMNLVVYPGERVGLVGKAGQGKTSVFNVLLRLVDTMESGAVYINGEDADRVPYPILRSWFAVIPQSPAVVSGTWRDNLLLGYHPSPLHSREPAPSPSTPSRRPHSSEAENAAALSEAGEDGADVAQIGDADTPSSTDEDGSEDRAFVPRSTPGSRARRRKSDLDSDKEQGSGTGNEARGRASASARPRGGRRSTFLTQAADASGAKSQRQRRRRNSQAHNCRSVSAADDRSASAPPTRLCGVDVEMQDRLLWRALRIVGLAYLCELDGGLDSPVAGTGSGALGESMGLLASQRQLLCLARAVLHKPPFILLEDAVSPASGDSASDQLIRQVLSNELRTSTAIIIIHRVRTATTLCTRVVAMKEGTAVPVVEPTAAAAPAEASRTQPPPMSHELTSTRQRGAYVSLDGATNTTTSPRAPRGSAVWQGNGLPSVAALAAFIE